MFQKKEWKNRVSEYPNRRTITNTDTQEVITAEIARDEGTVTQVGDTYSAENMNDLEDRISDIVDLIEAGLADVEESSTASRAYKVYSATNPQYPSLLVYEGSLYKVTQAIRSGATLIVGTNIVLTSLGQLLVEGLAAKQNTITGAATTVTTNNLTANRFVGTNSSGKLIAGDRSVSFLNKLDFTVVSAGTLSDVTVSNEVVRTLTTITVPPGRHLLTALAKFSGHADTGYRYAFLTSDSNGTGGDELMMSGQVNGNGANRDIYIPLTVIVSNSTESNKNYYFRAQHNAGTSLTVTPRYRFMTIVNSL